MRAIVGLAAAAGLLVRVDHRVLGVERRARSPPPPGAATHGGGGSRAAALGALRKGGTLVLGGIHMSPIPSFSYDLLYGERVIRSVANNTRRDGEEFLRLAAQIPIETHVKMFPLADANRALNSLRDGRRHWRDLSVDQTDEDEGPGYDVIDPAAEIEETLVERERAKRIWAAVEALPEKQRAAVLLHKYQDLGYDEIARILGCSESALKSLLFRAYETLRVRLAPLAPDATGAGKGR